LADPVGGILAVLFPDDDELFNIGNDNGTVLLLGDDPFEVGPDWLVL
jgi:hypothetical protein